MTAKRILRSTAAKLAAFLLILGCAASALSVVYSTLDQMTGLYHDGGLVYRLESSFQHSEVMETQINWQAQHLENILRSGGSDWSDSAAIDGFPGDYYARMDDVELKRGLGPEDDITDSAFYFRFTADGGMENNVPAYFEPFWEYDTAAHEYDGMIDGEEVVDSADSIAAAPEEQRLPENTLLMVRITEAQAETYSEMWNTQRRMAMNTVRRLLLFLVIAIIAYLYLLFVTGRKGDDEEVHLVTIDRLFVEFNLLIACGVLFLAGAANIALMLETAKYGDIDLKMFNVPCIVLFVAALALAVELSLSLVRNVKNRSFVQRSFILRACKWCWGIAARLCKWCWGVVKKAWHGAGAGKDALINALAKDYKMRRVLLVFFGYTAVLALLAAIFGAMMDYGEGFLAFVLGIAWFVLACVFLVRRIGGFDRIVDALKRLRAGDLGYKLGDMPAGVFTAMAEDINSLGDGMQAALQNEIRAERMKSELITNVSHDLKTPLTSILNYSDLLCQEHLTPEEANDYARIIHQKGIRLKNLTSDLFDISKVQSGAETMACERLDACTLVRQALAEQDAAIEAGGLALRLDLPEHEVPIWADGKKMSRVMENLIGNCIKYSLSGTRVFLSVAEQEGGTAVIEIKNIANYAMDFNPDEITERFVRGDEARSTEGSGLGLAIAKSYVAACGGELAVDVDGDLFKVRITFPIYGIVTK